MGHGPGPAQCARLLFNQQPGARVWQEIGGWQAVSREAALAQQQIYVSVLIAHGQAGGDGKPPPPPEPPVGLIEQRRTELYKAVTHEQKAHAYLDAMTAPGMQEMIEQRLAEWGDMREHTEAVRLNRLARERMAEW